MVTDICAYSAALSNVWQWFFLAISLWKILTIVGVDRVECVDAEKSSRPVAKVHTTN